MAHQLTGSTIASTYDQLIYRTTTVPSTGTTTTQLLTSEADQADDIALPLYISTAHVGINTATPGTWLASATSSATYLDIYDSAQPAVLSLGGNETSNAAIVGIVQFINDNNTTAASNNGTGKIIADITVAIETDDSNTHEDCGGDMYFKTKPLSGSLATRMTIKDDGKVGINNGAPLTNLHVQNPSGTSAAEIRGVDGSVAIFEEANSAQIAVHMATNTSKSMMLTSASALAFYVDDDPIGSGNYSDGNDKVLQLNSDRTVLMPYYGNGTASFASGTGLLATSSDARLKENVVTLPDGLSIVNQLNPVYFTWKEKEPSGKDNNMYMKDAPNDGKELGFIAQEVGAVLPQFSPDWGKDDEQWRGIQDRAIIAALTKAIQELSAKVTALEAA